MILRIAAPRSLAALPLLLLADANPGKYQLEFFTDHAEALRGLQEGRFDLLSTGFTELDRSQLICTYVWGLSALMVRDSSVKTMADLSRCCEENSGAELILPFLGSPLDLQVRALFMRILPEAKMQFRNQPLGETLAQYLAGNVFAAVLPEPMSTTLELAGKAFRLADLAELYAQVTGDARSPQVSLFAQKRKILPDNFQGELTQSIGRAAAMPVQQQSAVAKELGITEPVLGHALPHVQFGLPARTVAENLENQFLDFIAPSDQERKNLHAHA